MNLIKLLPVALGVVSVGTGAISTINPHQSHSVKQVNTDPFITWARSADSETNLKALAVAAHVLDWNATENYTIVKKSVNVPKEEVTFIIKNGVWGQNATVDTVYSGNVYNVNQWKCLIPPSKSNAEISYANWHGSWQSFWNNIDLKTKVKDIVNSWYNNQLKGEVTNNEVKNNFIDGAFLGIWNTNIQNFSDNDTKITFTIHVFPAFRNDYFQMHAVLNWNGARHFSYKQINPVDQHWADKS